MLLVGCGVGERILDPSSLFKLVRITEVVDASTDAGSTSVKVSPEQWSGKLTVGYNF